MTGEKCVFASRRLLYLDLIKKVNPLKQHLRFIFASFLVLCLMNSQALMAWLVRRGEAVEMRFGRRGVEINCRKIAQPELFSSSPSTPLRPPRGINSMLLQQQILLFLSSLVISFLIFIFSTRFTGGLALVIRRCGFR